MTENFNDDTEQKIFETLEETDFEEVEETEDSFESIAETDFENEYSSDDESILDEIEEVDSLENDYSEPIEDTSDEIENISYSEPTYTQTEEPAFENKFSFDEEMNFEPEIAHVENTQPHAIVEKFANELYNFEIPSNVAVLKKLISKLPSGVTRQTGAQIIKQTMEALGISIKNVLQDAQQVQDQLSSSAKECQVTIQEYKRQIATLEEQAQSYKKQYANLNELVSLFIQTDN